jgi:hypothetical protein
MKTTLLILMALSACAFGQTLPPDAAALQAKRDAKVAEINQHYAAALERLKKKAMAEGNLETAKLLESEIAKATPDPFFKPEEKYNGTVWAWGSGGELTLEKGGKATHTKWSRSGKWKVEGDSVMVESDTGTRFKVMFESSDAAQVISANGGSSTSLVKK